MRLTLENFDEWIDGHIEDFIRQAKEHSTTPGYHNSAGSCMDIGWIDCARFIKEKVKEDFKDESN